MPTTQPAWLVHTKALGAVFRVGAIGLVLALCPAAPVIAAKVPIVQVAQTAQTSKIPIEKRVALLIGNAEYGNQFGHIPNAANDAQDLAKILERLGFDVTLNVNVDRRSMLADIIDFDAALRSADVGLFYYAGHAVQIDGRNFMLPTDTQLNFPNVTPRVAADYVDLEAIDLDQIMSRLGVSGNRLNIVIMDACRNNPFTTGSRSVHRGLAQSYAPNGTFVAYALSGGKIKVCAIDSQCQNVLSKGWTGALSPDLHAIQVPAGRYQLVVGSVRSDPIELAGGEEINYEIGAVRVDNLGDKSIGVCTMESACTNSLSEGWAGSLKKEAPMLELPPGTYKLKLGRNNFIDALEIGAGEEVVIEDLVFN